MPNIKPVSDLRNYNAVLSDISEELDNPSVAYCSDSYIEVVTQPGKEKVSRSAKNSALGSLFWHSTLLLYRFSI